MMKAKIIAVLIAALATGCAPKQEVKKPFIFTKSTVDCEKIAYNVSIKVNTPLLASYIEACAVGEQAYTHGMPEELLIKKLTDGYNKVQPALEHNLANTPELIDLTRRETQGAVLATETGYLAAKTGLVHK